MSKMRENIVDRIVQYVKQFLSEEDGETAIEYGLIAALIALIQAVKRIAKKLEADGVKLACTRFRRHRVRCFHGTGGASWRGGSSHESSSLRLCA